MPPTPTGAPRRYVNHRSFVTGCDLTPAGAARTNRWGLAMHTRVGDQA
jgi:hypothetical protein